MSSAYGQLWVSLGFYPTSVARHPFVFARAARIYCCNHQNALSRGVRHGTIRNLFEDAPGTSVPGDRSPAESIPRERLEAPANEPSPSSSSSYITYPFEIWYRDDSRDSQADEPYAWVDDEVKKTFTQLNRSSSLLGMAKAICQKGAWSVRVSPCRAGESVNISSSSDEKPFFYLYDTLHSKLGIRLPFSHFERAVLQALNVAPTQLHPNSWAYVRAFELLCEDLKRASSLGVFFWFYTVKKAEKVGWTSLCTRPKRKLFQPFLASYKKFKTQFFKVTPGDNGPNLLADRAGRPFFPLYWTHQPAVSITVDLDNLDSWEKAFAKELGELPLLPSAKIIKGDDYSTSVLRELKRKAAERSEKEKQAATSAEPIAAAEPHSQQETNEVDSDTTSMAMQEAVNETVGMEAEVVISGSPLRFDEPTVGESPALDTEVPGVEEERPAKRRATETPAMDTAEVEGRLQASPGFQWDSLLSGVPSSSTRGPPSLLGQAVDQGLGSSDNNQVKKLRVAGTCKIVQQHAAYALIFARAAEKEFGKLESHCVAYEKRAAKFEADFLAASKACTEAEVKINSYRSATACLEEDLQRTISKNKDLTAANYELNTAADNANSRIEEVLQKENEDLGSSVHSLREELVSAESSLKQASEDVRSRDETIRLLEQTIEAQNRKIEEQDGVVVKMGGDIVEQFEAGFAKALGQIQFLHPDVDISEADPFKDLIDGQSASWTARFGFVASTRCRITPGRPLGPPVLALIVNLQSKYICMHASSNLLRKPLKMTLLAASACPFAWGCSTDVKDCRICSSWQNLFIADDANWVPLFETSSAGRPNRHIIFFHTNRFNLSAVIVAIGSASTHLVK
ncbi:hypothetical protein CR513_49145, partial [Mucuna pruriens]